MQDNLFIDFLPDSAKELLEVISLDSLKSLIAEYGGTHLSLCQNTQDEHDLIELIGKDEAKKLYDVFQGEFIIFETT